ncbi:MAG: hypothetical protein HQ482_13370 [Sphingomonadales bacterium]|nr:hypothetical protein [Sphingomonadales bacterium]
MISRKAEVAAAVNDGSLSL